MTKLYPFHSSPMSDPIFDATCDRPPLMLVTDATSARCSVALARGPEIVAEWGIVQNGPETHRILDDLARLLARVGVSPSEVDVFGALTGPGSFTGIRIGLATVKGMAQALEKPIVTATSLEVVAHAAPDCASRAAVCVMNVAFRDQIHAQAFLREADGATLPLTEAQSGDGETLVVNLTEAVAAQSVDAPVIWVGDAASAAEREIRNYAELCAARGVSLTWRCAASPRFLSAAAVPILLARWRAGACVAAANLEAFYVRASEAEKKRASV
jgi:tRNA threonylcarbamoyladenosine biosynthesis protein TsaB